LRYYRAAVCSGRLTQALGMQRLFTIAVLPSLAACMARSEHSPRVFLQESAACLDVSTIRSQTVEEVSREGSDLLVSSSAGPLFCVVLGLTRDRSVAGPKPKLRAQLGKLSIVLPHSSAELRWFVAVPLTAGFCEEFFFRAYLVWAFETLLGWWERRTFRYRCSPQLMRIRGKLALPGRDLSAGFLPCSSRFPGHSFRLLCCTHLSTS
jgi:hypothetical protein